VVRDEKKGREWSKRGCEVVIADMDDTNALAAAFVDAQGVFILPPTDFDPEPGYPEAIRVIKAVRAALDVARPDRVVCLSTIGADAEQDNLLTQRTMMEEALATLFMPVTFLRAGWFLDNALWDVPTAISEGVIHSFLQPLDKKYAMVASRDVGRTAAALIRERWNGVRVIELEGPARVSPNDLADAFTVAVGRPVRAVPVPHETWEDIFRSQGMRYPAPRIRMLDGFNEGWIDFPGENDRRLKGRISAGEVVASLVEAALEAETR